MKRAVSYLLICLLSLAIGGIAGAAIAVRSCDRHLGHAYVSSLMEDGWAAREIYRERGRAHADRLRQSFPDRVLAVEKEFREDDFRNTAFRVVGEAYASSGIEVPVEIRTILATVPPRPSREVPTAVK